MKIKSKYKFYSGIFLIYLGLLNAKSELWYHHGHPINNTGVNRTIGPLIILIGIFFIYFSFNGKKVPFSICKDCLESYDDREVIDNKCKICGDDLEPLEGFYDRHPDLK